MSYIVKADMDEARTAIWCTMEVQIWFANIATVVDGTTSVAPVSSIIICSWHFVINCFS